MARNQESLSAFRTITVVRLPKILTTAVSGLKPQKTGKPPSYEPVQSHSVRAGKRSDGKGKQQDHEKRM